MKYPGMLHVLASLALFVFGLSSAGHAEQSQSDQIKEMQKQIRILTEEVERLKLGSVAEPKLESHQGMGPAASKVYGNDKGPSLGGYGEVVTENYQNSSKKDFAESQRFILYSGYKFNDWVVMNTELEFEHGGIGNVAGRSPEVYVEFSYLDFLLKKDLNFRTGLMLMPIGLVNEYHEPTVFRGVKRPDVETNIIPSTWRELGTMVYGKAGRWSYNAAIVNGLRADRFTKGTWIRDGRQLGGATSMEKWGSIARVTYSPTDNLLLAGSYYRSDVGHGKGKDQNPLPGISEMEGKVNLWSLHAQFQQKSLQLRGLLTRGSLDGNTALQASGAGKSVGGWYTEASYDIFLKEKAGYRMTLTPFLRYEKYDTHRSVFLGTRDPSQARTVSTFGVDFKPHSQVVLKADFQWRDTESGLPSGKGTGMDENKIDQFNLGLGFIF